VAFISENLVKFIGIRRSMMKGAAEEGEKKKNAEVPKRWRATILV
jgi:hypothetical protein